MLKKFVFILIVAFLSLTIQGISQTKQKGQSMDFKYTGVKKCKGCHKGIKKGEIFEKWESSQHAKAYETLATDHAMEVARKAGIKGSPQQAGECLTCHVTGYNAPDNLKEMSLTTEEGISCEACHGAGSEYRKLKVMQDIYNKKVEPSEYGLIIPKESDCKTCHNPKNPTHKGFNFAEAYKIIEHHVPKD